MNPFRACDGVEQQPMQVSSAYRDRVVELVARSGILPVASIVSLALRMSIRSIRVPTSSRGASSPSWSKTAMPLGCNAKAAPISAGRSARSISATRGTTRLSTAAAASPPIPAPTYQHMVHIVTVEWVHNGHDASRSASGRQDDTEAAPEGEGEGRSNGLLVHSSMLGISERMLISCMIPPDWEAELNARTTLAWTGGGAG